MLEQIIRADLESGTVPTDVQALVDALKARHGEAVAGVVFYGSCRRTGQARDGLADLLVIVPRYRDIHGAGLAAVTNRLLPPNVYYLEADSAEGRVRCKYAVISLAEFRRRTRRGRDAYFWARFAQPCRLALARDESTRQEIAAARVGAVIRFAERVAPLVRGAMDAAGFWSRALEASYRCELRPEAADTAQRLVHRDLEYYRAITPHALAGLDFAADCEDGTFELRPSGFRRMAARMDWGLRRVWGKLLNLARLFKAAGTFTNGIDYLVWKVERHSGVRIEPTERMRRYPRLAAWGLAWRLWRQGAVR